MKRFLEIYDVFPGQLAVYGNRLAAVVAQELERSPHKMRVDMWGRPLFVQYGVVVEGKFTVSVKDWFDMTRKKGTTSNGTEGSSTGSVGKTRWLNVNLLSEHEGDCERLASDSVQLASGWLGLAAGGNLDISLKRTDSGDYMACLFGKDDRQQQCGLSSWASTPSDAIAGLLIKWHVILDGDFGDTSETAKPSRFR
jgi:hypothetical protein